MAKLTPRKIDLSKINNGNAYENGDGVQIETFNAPIESSAYTQALATNAPNIDEISSSGTPYVGIEEVNGLPRFVFKSISGGGSGVQVVQTSGNSTTAVMSQDATTKLIQSAITTALNTGV